MEFLLTDSDRDLRDRAGRFTRDVLDRFAAPPAFPLRAWTLGLRDELRTAGFTGLRIPAVLGGTERTALQTALVLEAVGRESPPLAFFLAAHNGFCAAHILKFGSEEQTTRLLPLMVSGECPGSWRYPVAGTASRSGKPLEAVFQMGGWTLRNGPVFEHRLPGEIAVVFARMMEGGETGCSGKIFIVRDSGPSSNPRAEMLGGKEGVGEDTLEAIGRPGRIYTAACRLGMAAALLSRALENASDPEARAETAEALVQLEAARFRTYRACLLEDAGRSAGGEEAVRADRTAEKTVRTAIRIAAGRTGGPELMAGDSSF